MLPFLQSLLLPDLAQGAAIADLCLDYELISDQHPAKFEAIAGMELFPNLEELSVVNQDIALAIGLASLDQLKRLNLSHNLLQDLGEIPSLSRLRWLDVSHNELESLAGIQSLGQLTELQLGFNLLQDLSPLADLPALSTLVINGNRHVRSLDDLPRSLQALHAAKCYLHDYRGLLALPQLQQLTLSPGSLAQLDLLSDLPCLTHLHLQCTRMHGTVRIPPQPELRVLKLSKAQMVVALDLPMHFPKLESLQIHHASIQAIPDLRHCPSLAALTIQHAPLQNLDGLAELKSLKYLNLEGSAIPTQALVTLRAARPELEIVF